jgi:hypothetical protein
MPRLLLKLALIIAAIFTLISWFGHLLGSTQTPNSVLQGFAEGCDGKPQPCWNGIVPSVTKFDDVPMILGAVPAWEQASVEKIARKLGSLWQITNPDFTDCTVIIDQKEKSFDLVGTIDFRICSHILLGDLADLIEYPGSIYQGCTPPDNLLYRLISISTGEDLTFRGENTVNEFILYGQQTKTEWIELLNSIARNNMGADYWTDQFRYAEIGFSENGCG